jgi:hypothetical protein
MKTGRPPKPAGEKYMLVTVSLPAEVGRWLKSQDNASAVVAEALKLLRRTEK